MSTPFKLVRVGSLKTASDFKKHAESLGITLPLDEVVSTGADSPLQRPVEHALINGKKITNRICIQPMEGWDATSEGGITEEIVRRWGRFGESGAKLIFGGEAMAVRPDGRANPNQLILSEKNLPGIAQLRETLVKSHQEKFGNASGPVIGFQLTHSGRFCRPNDQKVWESRVAYRHPLLDKKFSVENDSQVFTDGEIEMLIQDYISAARVAEKAGADFVDVKHCHGYLLHEFLSAHTRPGKYGGSFENRTRPLREIVGGIRAAGLKLDIAVRLSAFDFVPFKPDPAKAEPGKLGPGTPEDYRHLLPYQCGFGTDCFNPVAYDLAEPKKFVELCVELGIKILNFSAGSPYYNPHIQRPAAYPPSDGYQPAYDPLIDVARQIEVVRELKKAAGNRLIIVGSAYSYLQEFLPHVAQFTIREGWTDLVGMGRMVLSYPSFLTDGMADGKINSKLICRTFSDCTTAPRNGLKSGCYPLDKYYTTKPEFQELKKIKKNSGV